MVHVYSQIIVNKQHKFQVFISYLLRVNCLQLMLRFYVGSMSITCLLEKLNAELETGAGAKILTSKAAFCKNLNNWQFVEVALHRH